MRASEFVSEKWSEKYKRSINCANPRGFSQRAHCAGRKKNEDVAEGLNEFAPPGSNDGGDDGFSEETLKRLASQWYNGDEDPRVERTLMAAGWEIGQDEGYDDEPGVFVVQAGDINGNSYISWPAHELKQGVAEGTGNGYYYLQGGIERSKKFASEAEAMAHSKRFFQLARVRRVTLKYKEPGQPPVVVKEFTFNDPEPPKSQMSWGDFYLQNKKQGMSEEQLDELTFKGSPCTKDCSGHRAGYEWSRRKGGRDAASWSRSFNNGAALFKNGF